MVQTDSAAALLSAVTIPPVGPLPAADDLLAGSLLYGTNDTELLELVRDDDLASPHTAMVLNAIRALVTVSPQLVLDELVRRGAPKPATDALLTASTSGAAAGAARQYAAATVAASLRRRVESHGHALQTAAREASEADLARLVLNGAEKCAEVAQRLAALRGVTG